ncbi:spondin domain-containing protein [uncultured Lacinutrix sp.]|uniref:T9SS type A sorting domain-containing protein n=1 Tax=uncultured Lacinutrix sp. TaxID=574032 RepID=UPI0026305833|nr:spondin domain-containing protein [uncultured Lacinutrix sp.]
MKKLYTLAILLICFNVKVNSQCAPSSENEPVYKITFQSTWNATEHTSIPNGAHWSDLVIISHNSPNQFIEIGENASLGIKNMAELGDNTALIDEVSNAVIAGNAHFGFQNSFVPNNANASLELEQNFCLDFPYITIVSMIAPSPDWFIAVNSIDIRDYPQEESTPIAIDVFAYDAGTDNGTDYDSPNSPNAPVGISMINGYPFNGNKIGTLTIEYLTSLLSTPEFDSKNKIKISPNPATDNITISSANTINTIQIYNILGSIVKDITLEKKSSVSINIADLSKGIYLVKTKNNNGGINTKKLIIK